MDEFRWNEWNLEHTAIHGVTRREIEFVILTARPPYPELRGDEKWLVIGQTAAGQFIQVVFVEDDEGSLFPIHARPLTDREKHRYRKRKK